MFKVPVPSLGFPCYGGRNHFASKYRYQDAKLIILTVTKRSNLSERGPISMLQAAL